MQAVRNGETRMTKAQEQLVNAAKRALRYFDQRPAMTMSLEMLETSCALHTALRAVEAEETLAREAASLEQMMDRR